MIDFGDLIAAVLWIGGFIIAKGFWQTVASVVIFPYAWYLFIERCMNVFGII